MKKNILIFCLLFSIGILFVIVLYKISENIEKHGFKRNFSPNKVRLENETFLKNESYAFISVDPGGISLYKFKKPSELLYITMDLKEQVPFTLPYFLKDEKTNGMNAVRFINNYRLVLSGKSASVYKGEDGKSQFQIRKLDTVPFYQSEILDTNSFLITSKLVDHGFVRRNLVKKNWQGNQINNYVIEKQIDGYFCTDGQFRYERDSKRLIYMYYYRGQFICLDTNLKVIYKANTIDTLKHAKIMLTKNSDNTTTYLKPPTLVNRGLCVAENHIYILSKLMADNENIDDFRNSQVIDVYSLKDGKYSYSFYLPLLERQKLYEFQVFNDRLIATYKNRLAVYKLPSHL